MLGQKLIGTLKLYVIYLILNFKSTYLIEMVQRKGGASRLIARCSLEYGKKNNCDMSLITVITMVV